jgi:hypothetical protein
MLILIGLCFGTTLWAQSEKKGIEVDFLASYYDQDGENSPVTGGMGTEELQSASPVFLIRYESPQKWAWRGSLGVDNITSASTDNIDLGQDNVSSASRLDNRVFFNASVAKPLGSQTLGGGLGFSKEYDYTSINGGLNWSMDFNGKNDTLAVSVYHYQDDIELFGIDGVRYGEDTRETTDFSVSFSHVFGKGTVGSIEAGLSDASGFLSSPFQEVILADQSIAQERLPDSRERQFLRLSLNHAFNSRLILRSYYRFYDDDFGIQAQSLEMETHFRLFKGSKTWLYPIFRLHMQDGSDYFGLPGTFTGTEAFYTADRDLSEFDSTKFGIGAKIDLGASRIKRLQTRLTHYSRNNDEFEAVNLSFGFGFDF